MPGRRESPDLVAIAAADTWFTYYYWQDDRKAARTVDIHRKPGYDPAELFLDPTLRLPKLKVGLKLLKRRLASDISWTSFHWMRRW